MSDFSRIAPALIRQEELEIKSHQMKIDLIRLWVSWVDPLVEFASGAIKADTSTYLVLSTRKICQALAGIQHRRNNRRKLTECYSHLREVAIQGVYARFGREAMFIEVARPALPEKYIQPSDLLEPDDNNLAADITSPKVGDILKGTEIPYADEADTYIYRKCPVCGQCEWAKLNGNGKAETQKCEECILFRRPISGKQPTAPRMKTGKNGYVLILLPEADFYYPMATKYGYVMEHRLVMAKHLGRCLQRFEVVHHKNGIKDDNRLENLELVATVGEHIANHNSGYEGGYKHGLYDGRLEQVKKLRARITELEKQVADKEVQYALN